MDKKFDKSKLVEFLACPKGFKNLNWRGSASVSAIKSCANYIKLQAI